MEEVKIEQYISKMTDLQRKAFLIAKSHLGTSFNIKKSNGFKEFQRTNASSS
jgi:hypothetical protein